MPPNTVSACHWTAPAPLQASAPGAMIPCSGLQGHYQGLLAPPPPSTSPKECRLGELTPTFYFHVFHDGDITSSSFLLQPQSVGDPKPGLGLL